MRIYWPIGNTKALPGRTDRGDLIEATLLDYAAAVVAPGTSVTIGWMKKAGTVFSSDYLGMIHTVHVIADILAAERAGFDAAMIGPHWDPGLHAAREAATIPVTGGGEAAMMVAQTLGRRFAMLTTREGLVPHIERCIAAYGYEARAIARRPVRTFGMSFEALIDALEGSGEAFFDGLTRAAKGCIEDGADVILAGGQLFGPAFLRHGYRTVPGTGVPVVDVAACGLKLAEALVSLRRSIGLDKSQHPNAPFRSPERSEIQAMLDLFGMG